MLIEASLLVSVYHMTWLSLTFSTGLGITLQSQYTVHVLRGRTRMTGLTLAAEDSGSLAKLQLIHEYHQL